MMIQEPLIDPVTVSAALLRGRFGAVVALDVTLDEYMNHYAADHCEWIDGVVIRVSPSELAHNTLIACFTVLLGAYLELRPVGRMVTQPFVMRNPAFPNRRREPDVFVVLNGNPHALKNTFMDGPADLVIEIVSEDSIERDHGEKFEEYEKGGVPEYWIIDPLHREARFYRQDESGRYLRQNEDAAGIYRTPALPGLQLDVSLLWRTPLPGPIVVGTAVRCMLEADHR